MGETTNSLSNDSYSAIPSPSSLSVPTDLATKNVRDLEPDDRTYDSNVHRNQTFENLFRPFSTSVIEQSFSSRTYFTDEPTDISGLSIQNSDKKKPTVRVQQLGAKVNIICLVLLTLMALAYTMYFAKAIVLPIVFAFMINFFLSPVIRRLERWRIPPPVGAILIILAAIGPFLVFSVMAYAPAKDWISRAPGIMRDVETKLRPLRDPINELGKTGEQIDRLVNGQSESDAAEEEQEKQEAKNGDVELPLPFGGKVKLEADDKEEAESEVAIPIKASKPIPVQLQEPSLTGQFISTTGNVVIGVFLTFVLVYFLLAAGDRGLEKMVEMMPTWTAKRNIVELTREIQHSISDYLFTTSVINCGLGIVIGLGMWIIGLPNPVLWGAMACFLNFLPFIGCFVGAAIVFMVALVSFDSVGYSLLAPAIYLFANLIEGNFVTPTLVGRSISLHPVWLMVFFSVVTWIWGVPGAVVAVPLLAVCKIVCDHVEPLHPLGKFLGR